MDNLTPLTDNCQKIMLKRQFAIIGISPFNSFFSVEKMTKMVSYIAKHFNKVKIFIPDGMSSYTLEALGYLKKEAKQKTQKQDNYLNNKTKKVLDYVSQYYDISTESIILASKIIANDNYLEVYEACKTEFNSNKNFYDGCMNTSQWVLECNSQKNKNTDISETSKLTAVEYFLKELPLFLNAVKIENQESCVFIYISASEFLQQIYQQRAFYPLLSENQGYAIYKETDTDIKT